MHPSNHSPSPVTQTPPGRGRTAMAPEGASPNHGSQTRLGVCVANAVGERARALAWASSWCLLSLTACNIDTTPFGNSGGQGPASQAPGSTAAASTATTPITAATPSSPVVSCTSFIDADGDGARVDGLDALRSAKA